MDMDEWGGNPVYLWLGLYFSLLCGLDEASCIGCYWQLDDARSYIEVVAFVATTVYQQLSLFDTP